MIKEKINKEISLTLEGLRKNIIENHIRAGQRVSSRTIESMIIEESETGAKLKGRKAFHTLETGRKRGKVPYNFQDIIKQWIIDKGFSISPIPYKRKPSERWQPKYTPEQRGLSSFAGAIAYKIAKEGTSLSRSGGRKDIFTEPTDEAVMEIKQKLSQVFKTEIKRL